MVHLAYTDYKTKLVYVWEYVLLFLLCIIYSYNSLSVVNILFAVVPFVIPGVPIADRFGLASLSLLSIHATVLSIVISYVLERLNITTAYYPSALLSFLIIIFIKSVLPILDISV